MRSRTRNTLAAGLAIAGLAFAPLTNAQLFDGQRGHGDSKDTMVASELIGANLTEPTGPAACTDVDGDGTEDAVTVNEVTFQCDGLDLVNYLPTSELFADTNTDVLTGGGLSDIWGWTSPATGEEYVLVGATNGVAAIRVNGGESPEYLGHVFNTGAQLLWFDIKINDDHAYIVSESLAMGMKILDLSILDSLPAVPAGTTVPLPVATFPIDLTAHNVVIDETQDMLYLVGSGNAGGALLGASDSYVCNAFGADVADTQGLFGFDISVPQLPVLVGCHTTEGYVHDAQCTTYTGPDPDHQDASICITAHEDGVAVVDVTDPSSPVTLSDTTDEDYPDATYSHQGWMSEDQTRYFHGDELDEQDRGLPTRTFVFDITDLDDITLEFINEPGGTNIDHNMYTHRGLLFQSNYAAGLQVFDQEPVVTTDTDDNVVSRSLDMVAQFDIYPDCTTPYPEDFDSLACDGPVFVGTWSNYPYFDSGTIPVTSYDGLFFLKLDPELADAYTVDGEGEEAGLPAQAAEQAHERAAAKGRNR